MIKELNFQGKKIQFEVVNESDNFTEIKLGEKIIKLNFLKNQGDKIIWEYESKIYPISVNEINEGNVRSFMIENGDERYHLAPIDRKKAMAKTIDSSEKGLHSPMPGKIFKILGKAGDQVVAGTPLLVLEAMKMEHTIKAPFAGVIESYPFKIGDQIPIGAKLVNLKKNE